MALPIVNIQITNEIYRLPENGSLVYKYAPLYNLRGSSEYLESLQVSSRVAKIDINTPLELDITPSYDNSANIIINDKNNPLKLVNSRFYLDSSKTYKISDREDSVNTNVYTEENFLIETKFNKSIDSIVQVDFMGIESGGILPVGNYHFYFKLSDADGNETDFIAESGLVTCHIGSVNDPKSIRGGQLNENSGKLVKFTLRNLDLSYSFINVYFSKRSGSNEVVLNEVYQINNKFSIRGESTEISITGYENMEKFDESILNINYANFDSVISKENCQNMTFVGNIQSNKEIFKTLEKYSLFITPQLYTGEEIGKLNDEYEDISSSVNKYEYYNTKNIYYRVGYWDEEIYRFGIVYILNDYTLSPVFNIRGIKELKPDTTFSSLLLNDEVEYDTDSFIIKGTSDNPENIKGVFKINNTTADTFSATGAIKPIGLKFNFSNAILNGNYKNSSIKDLTKGFFFVRQDRIPTIITQGIPTATSKLSGLPIIYGSFDTSPAYFSESFLTKQNNTPKLGRSQFKINEDLVRKNALFCPEASLLKEDFRGFFNSSEFILQNSKYRTGGAFSDPSLTNDRKLFYLTYPFKDTSYTLNKLKANLLLVTPGISKINNNSSIFSSQAGNKDVAWETEDLLLGNLEDDLLSRSEDEFTKSTSRVRGIFNTYVGVHGQELNLNHIYNIFQKDYDFDKWKDYFKVRYNNSSFYFPIGDRYSWDDLTDTTTNPMYRGDCFINSYTHRVLWNFIDPELPTTTKILDRWTWYRNYRVKQISLTEGGDGVWDVTAEGNVSGTTVYNKLLDLYTFDDENLTNAKVVQVDAPKFEKYSEENGLYGISKLNRPDINAVSLGHWVTFKVCSNINLAMRDVDYSQSMEESIHHKKRSFYPLENADYSNRLPESDIINKGLLRTYGDRYYFNIPEAPFIKTTFNTRIYYSNLLQNSAFKNGNRLFESQNYRDYTNEYGSIVKLIEWSGQLLVVMEHGVLLIPINERAMMTNSSGENVYINTDNVLPKNPKVLSSTFGSIWPESIIKTNRFIYGIDTIGKKIWRTNGETFNTISDLKIQKFLNDNLKISKSDSYDLNNVQSVKSHYNAFKSDVLFVIQFNDIKWNLCWNELQELWITKYSWFPEFSENINNIFYTFANEANHNDKGNFLYKHGFAGDSDESVNINPTHWYGTQYPFEFEFVVIGESGVQKIFDNLKIISNNTSPSDFYYEIDGDSYSFSEEKEDIYTFTTQQEFEDYLIANTTVKKVPYIFNQSPFIKERETLKDITLYRNNKLKNIPIQSYQKGMSIKTFGRLIGNMEYVEDAWDIQIQPLSFKYAYLKNGNLVLSDTKQVKIRDKYIKIRIRYSGTKYAIINSLLTLFTISYA